MSREREAETHVISLGAGVQSSTMALMAARGEIGPMPVAAIFADTKQEPMSVYKWLEWLEPQLPFPVHRVSRGDLGEDATRLRTSKVGKKYTKHAIPAFIVDGAGRAGLLMRQCTASHKIEVIRRELRRLVGRKGRAVQWIGISIDEAHRMKDPREKWITNRWPLVEAGMTRAACLRWMADNGYPEPPRSACVFCPFHSNAEWRRLRSEEPDEFAKAVEFEKKLAASVEKCSGFRGRVYLHPSLQPLDAVDWDHPHLDKDQPSLWGNECEGMCGV